MAIWWTNKSILLGGALILLCACEDHPYGIDMNKDTYINPNKIRVTQDVISQEFLLEDMTPEKARSLAASHKANGGGRVDILVTYPAYGTAKAQAQKAAANVVQAFYTAGLRDVGLEILPIADSAPARLQISFATYGALAPEGCDPMPGVDGRGAQLDRDYPMGCAVDTAIAKQIARPSDLLGEDVALPPRDGQPSGEVIQKYRTGEKAEDLKEEKTSD